MDPIRQAANILDISEYDLLARAYRAWHGTAPCDRTLSRTFRQHLGQGRTPGWALHYARRVIAEFERHEAAPGWLGFLVRAGRRARALALSPPPGSLAA